MTEDHGTAGHRGNAGSPTAAEAAAMVLSRLTDLARTSLATEASLAKQSVDLAWASLAGDVDRTSANRAYVDSVTRESARYWRTVGELGVDYATDLVTLGKSVSTTILREVAAAGRKPGTRPPAGGHGSSTVPTSHHAASEGDAPQGTDALPSDRSASGVSEGDSGGRRVNVTLRGSVGGRAEGTITVANQHPRPRRIQLSAGTLTDAAGTAAGASMEVSPTAVTVPSGQERSVSLGVDLDTGSFSAGKRYSCTVQVSGGDEATIDVTLEVSP